MVFYIALGSGWVCVSRWRNPAAPDAQLSARAKARCPAHQPTSRYPPWKRILPRAWATPGNLPGPVRWAGFLVVGICWPVAIL